MISSLRGTVLTVTGGTVVIEVAGVGFAVTVTHQHASALRAGSEAQLHTALIVREDDLSVFGFAQSEELEVFNALRSVTGVGPKSALGVLAEMTPVQIADSIAREDDAAFRKVSGIGPKTAKLIVLSLAGKLAPSRANSATVASAVPVEASVLSALIGLGWNERSARLALDEVCAEATEAEREHVPTLLRLALGRLGPAQYTGSSAP